MSKIFSIALVVSVSLLVIVPIPQSSGVVTADENDDEAVVPEWYEGDYWKYEIEESLAEDMTLFTEVEKEVVKERVDINVDIFDQNGQKQRTETYKTYKVEENHVTETKGGSGEDEPEDTQGDFHYTHDTLSLARTHPEGGAAGYYVPPLRELNFTLSVGDNWTSREGHYVEEKDDGSTEAVRRVIQYQGRVEKRVRKEVEAGTFNTFMVNFSVLAENLKDDTVEWRRYEIFYSPEVKNVVHREIYETMKLPSDKYGIGDEVSPVKEENIGNETLLDYDVEPYEPGDPPDESPFLGVGPLLMLGVGTAAVYYYKKRRKYLEK